MVNYTNYTSDNMVKRKTKDHYDDPEVWANVIKAIHSMSHEEFVKWYEKGEDLKGQPRNLLDKRNKNK